MVLHILLDSIKTNPGMTPSLYEHLSAGATRDRDENMSNKVSEMTVFLIHLEIVLLSTSSNVCSKCDHEVLLFIIPLLLLLSTDWSCRNDPIYHSCSVQAYENRHLPIDNVAVTEAFKNLDEHKGWNRLNVWWAICLSSSYSKMPI